jgi:predicted  nucleic acid-binding Zn-ribbon protein
MNTIVGNLHALQQTLLQKSPVTAERRARIRELRENVPAPILSHFDRLIAQGRKGVALVRHGVCGQCHLRVSTGTASSLLQPEDVYLCENCGCYLLLAPDEAAAPAEPPAVVVATVRKGRKKPAVVTA